MNELQLGVLWDNAFAVKHDGLDSNRGRLSSAFQLFRERVATLVASINAELPGLTVHDVTHLDALWSVASEICGPNYELNPAEAFVLGGAILLHDAAHCLAAYPGGLTDIKNTVQWKDLIAQRFTGNEPAEGSARAKAAAFEVLRQLHSQQCEKLLSLEWHVPRTDARLYLLEDQELRLYYGNLIGLIAASHHWHPHRVAQEFSARKIPAPGFLSPAKWNVDALKVAFLLRTADAAHIDGLRAPLFAFALRQPEGTSLEHWSFQSKLGQPTASEHGELQIASASTFSVEERKGWWLAYDTARMVDRELRAAHTILRDEGRIPFASSSVLGAGSPETFAKHVQCDQWSPVDVSPRINDIPHVIQMLGGTKLYGDDLSVPVRELLQNACDAVRALRKLGGLNDLEGEVILALESADEGGFWLSAWDTGIGMSKHVLTDVLLDFGHSLWGSDILRDEWPGLASRQFTPAGQFGIGFFSTFMLGDEIVVNTRRHVRYGNESADQWTLGFDDGVQSRPWLRVTQDSELLPRAGTRVSVRMSGSICDKIMERWHGIRMQGHPDVSHMLVHQTQIPSQIRRQIFDQAQTARPKAWLMTENNIDSDEALANWSGLVAWLCPASEVTIRVRCGTREKVAVTGGDWVALPEKELLERLCSQNSSSLTDLKDGSRLVGRLGIGLGNVGVAATLVHRGIRCGQFGVISGLAVADVPKDVSRQKAVIPCAREVWHAWLTDIVARNKSIPLQTARILHALDPTVNVPVVLTAQRLFSLPECEASMASVYEIVAFFDDLGRMIWDPPWGFGGPPLTLLPNVWIFPSLLPHKIEEITATHQGVGYREIVEAQLRRAWGSFSLTVKPDHPIGIAGPEPLRREAFVYSRPVKPT